MLSLILCQVVDPAVDPAAFVKALFEAIHSGNGKVAVVMAVVGLAWLARSYGPKLWAPLGKTWVVTLISTVGSIALAIAHAAMAGAPITLRLVIDALLVGLPALFTAILAERRIAAAEAAGAAAAAKVDSPDAVAKVLGAP